MSKIHHAKKDDDYSWQLKSEGDSYLLSQITKTWKLKKFFLDGLYSIQDRDVEEFLWVMSDSLLNLNLNSDFTLHLTSKSIYPLQFMPQLTELCLKSYSMVGEFNFSHIYIHFEDALLG